ncbi:MAG TPA: glycosyltransferase [bacterium]|nr:glycosyltransferase [bacterium]
MKNKPLVSIITPNLSQGDFIEDNILCIRNQIYENIEHIIIDGSSTDNTLEILRNMREGTICSGSQNQITECTRRSIKDSKCQKDKF